MTDTGEPGGKNVFSLEAFRKARADKAGQQTQGVQHLEGTPTPERVLRGEVEKGLKTLNIPLVYRPSAVVLALELSDYALAFQILNEMVNDWNAVKDIQLPERTTLKLDIDLSVFMENLAGLANTIDTIVETNPQEELYSLSTRTGELIHDVANFIKPGDEDEVRLLEEDNVELLDRMIMTQAAAEEFSGAANSKQPPTRKRIEAAFIDSWSGLDPELTRKMRLEAVTEYAPLLLEHPEYQSEIFSRTVALLLEESEGAIGSYEDLLDQFEDLLTHTDVPENNRVQMLHLLQRSFYKRMDEHVADETEEERNERRTALSWFWSELCARLEVEGQGKIVAQMTPASDPPSEAVNVTNAIRLAHHEGPRGDDTSAKLVLELENWYAFEMKQTSIDYHRIAHIGALLWRQREHSGSAQTGYTEIERLLAGRMHQNEEIREAFLQLMVETGQQLEHTAVPKEWLMVSRVGYFTRNPNVMAYAQELLVSTGLTVTFNRDEVPWRDVLSHYAAMAELSKGT